MIYKFRSKAGADLIMLGTSGDEMLRLLGREPAAKGILEPADLPAARHALQAALTQAEEEARRARAEGRDEHEGQACERHAVGLRQRLWPMLQLIERAAAAGEPIVWGV
jgi:hypothetical protein